MYRGIFLLVILATQPVFGEIVTIKGQKYYKVGDHSTFVGTAGSMDEVAAREILRIAKRAYEQDKDHILKELWTDLHVVYRGQLYGDIMLFVIRGHLNATLKRFEKVPYMRLGAKKVFLNGLVFRGIPTNDGTDKNSYRYKCHVVKGLFDFGSPEAVVLRVNSFAFETHDEDSAAVAASLSFPKSIRKTTESILDRLFGLIGEEHRIRKDGILEALFIDIVATAKDRYSSIFDIGVVNNQIGWRVAQAYAGAFANFFDHPQARQEFVKECGKIGVYVAERSKPSKDF